MNSLVEAEQIDVAEVKETELSYDAVLDLLSALSGPNRTLGRDFLQKTFDGQLLNHYDYAAEADSTSEATMDFRRGDYTLITPDESDREIAVGLVEQFREYADRALEDWNKGELLRLLIAESGQDQLWIYNAQAVITLRDINEWDLLEVHDKRYWQPTFDVTPALDEHGNLIPYSPDSEIVVLPAATERLDGAACIPYQLAAVSAAPESAPVSIVHKAEAPAGRTGRRFWPLRRLIQRQAA